MTIGNIIQFVQTWGHVIGLSLDIVGATLVYRGVRTPLRQAFLLERQVVGESIAEIGAPELLAQNEVFKRDRARERSRASQYAWWGFVFFVVGFLIQTISVWPKSA